MDDCKCKIKRIKTTSYLEIFKIKSDFLSKNRDLNKFHFSHRLIDKFYSCALVCHECTMSRPVQNKTQACISKIMVLLSATLSQNVDFKNFATARRSS